MKIDIAQRYTQVANILKEQSLFIEEIRHALQPSENYARKLVADLCYSGHLTQERVRAPGGRIKSRFRWQADKPVPAVDTRQCQQSKQHFGRRTDPLMIALYGEA